LFAAAVLILGIASLIFGVVHFISPHEPSYKGKTLSEWIVPFCRQTAKGLDAPGGPQHFEELEPTRIAIRNIGTNAVPFLIARLNHRESGLHREARKLLEKQPYGPLRLTDPNLSKVRAIRALAVLGSDAELAIPNLADQLTNATLSEHALHALSGMSADGMRAIVEQYTNVPAPLRLRIATMIMFPKSVHRGENGRYLADDETVVAGVLVDGLCRLAEDRTMMFRMTAIQHLGEFGPTASNAVPMLLQILNNQEPFLRHWTIRALGQIKSQPEVVVPALTNLLSDPDMGTRLSAASALRAFGYNVQPLPSGFMSPAPYLPKRTERYF
jgi:HEAT repeat protein